MDSCTSGCDERDGVRVETLLDDRRGHLDRRLSGWASVTGVDVDRAMAGEIPYAATGSGRPIVVCPGLWPTTGVDSNQLVRGGLALVQRVGEGRKIVLNRRSGLPVGMTMGELAGEYAEVIRQHFGAPVDLVGMSTGGSIAQQIAADHPDVVRRLVLVSTACRLSPEGRQLQARVAAELRAGRTRAAAGLAAGSLVPRVFALPARSVGWLAARRVLPDETTIADLASTIEAEDPFDLAACARPIEAKTLIVAGARDGFYGRDLFEETAALIPGSVLKIIERRGHITVTTDRRVQATIAGFLTAS